MTTKLVRRAEFLADKYGLSPQLTLIWLKQHPYDQLRPMRPAALADLRQWAGA